MSDRLGSIKLGTQVYSKNEVDGLLGGKQDVLVFDDTPTDGSDNPVTSGGIRAAIVEYVDDKVASVYRFSGSVQSLSDLPSENVSPGDVYNVSDTDMNYAWAEDSNDGHWDPLGPNLSGYATTNDLAVALAGKADSAHTHAQSDVTGLANALSGKADAVHTHQQSDVTGLANALGTKVDKTGDTMTGPLAISVNGTTVTFLGREMTVRSGINPARTIEFPNNGGTLALTQDLAGKADASALSAYLPTTGGTISGGLAVTGEIGSGVSIYASGTITSNSSIYAHGTITSNSTISASGTIASSSTISASGANIGNSGISSYGSITSNSRIAANGEIMSNSTISASGAISSSTIIYSNTGGFQTQNVRLLANRFTVNDSGTARDIDLPSQKAGTIALTSDIDTAMDGKRDYLDLTYPGDPTDYPHVTFVVSESSEPSLDIDGTYTYSATEPIATQGGWFKTAGDHLFFFCLNLDRIDAVGPGTATIDQSADEQDVTMEWEGHDPLSFHLSRVYPPDRLALVSELIAATALEPLKIWDGGTGTRDYDGTASVEITKATKNDPGVVKLIDAINADYSATSGHAATPLAVRNAYAASTNYADTAIAAATKLADEWRSAVEITAEMKATMAGYDSYHFPSTSAPFAVEFKAEAHQGPDQTDYAWAGYIDGYVFCFANPSQDGQTLVSGTGDLMVLDVVYGDTTRSGIATVAVKTGCYILGSQTTKPIPAPAVIEEKTKVEESNEFTEWRTSRSGYYVYLDKTEPGGPVWYPYFLDGTSWSRHDDIYDPIKDAGQTELTFVAKTSPYETFTATRSVRKSGYSIGTSGAVVAGVGTSLCLADAEDGMTPWVCDPPGETQYDGTWYDHVIQDKGDGSWVLLSRSPNGTIGSIDTTGKGDAQSTELVFTGRCVARRTRVGMTKSMVEGILGGSQIAQNLFDAADGGTADLGQLGTMVAALYKAIGFTQTAAQQ